jgi:hypothetical protein
MNVNLDALIPREDFEVKDAGTSSFKLPAIQIRDLEYNAFLYRTLRKPDFQRETSDWAPEKICDFIESFLEGDLIPSVIFWNSGGLNFVIDGAHRLSALISWVMDDYGDGSVSKAFFGYNISKEQLDIAEKTRKLVKKKIGNYQEYQYAITNPDKVDPTLLSQAMKLATLTIQLQWVAGDSSKAEASFFKINEQATPIDETEKILLKSRKKPNAIAARAIIRSGTGHKYWSKFTETNRNEIEVIAKSINEILFSPALQTPIKTLDLPLAGKGYSSQTLSMILDLINVTNNIKKDTDLSDDNEGDETINLLKNTRKILYRVSANHPSSLGLHPAVYFYGITGKYQITSFLTFIELFKEFESRNNYSLFYENRENFENFLIKYKSIVNQFNFKYGSGLKSYRHMKSFYMQILNYLANSIEEVDIIKEIKAKKEYHFISFTETELDQTNRADFSSDNKSAVFLRDALKSPIKCKICNGLIHKNSISIDHKDRKEDGGIGSIENGQLTHPYCNTAIKN